MVRRFLHWPCYAARFRICSPLSNNLTSNRFIRQGMVSWCPPNSSKFSSYLPLPAVSMYLGISCRSLHLYCRNSLEQGPQKCYPTYAIFSWGICKYWICTGSHAAVCRRTTALRSSRSSPLFGRKFGRGKQFSDLLVLSVFHPINALDTYLLYSSLLPFTCCCFPLDASITFTTKHDHDPYPRPSYVG
jgi:hypothetical protein